MRCHSLPPIASPDAWVLVLGTMPGRASLRAQQYYAHTQNAFWKITAEIFGFDASSTYSDRVSSLEAHGVAVWDVLKSCTRPSSLDSDIDMSTVVPNDFERFFAGHPRIRRVCFNGAKAASLYRQRVQPQFRNTPAVEHVRLPSTSPANAGISRAEKLREWRAIERPEPANSASLAAIRDSRVRTRA